MMDEVDQLTIHHLRRAIRWEGCRDWERRIGTGVLARVDRKGLAPTRDQWTTVRRLVWRWRAAVMPEAAPAQDAPGTEAKLAAIAILDAEELRGWMAELQVRQRPMHPGEREALLRRARELGVQA